VCVVYVRKYKKIGRATLPIFPYIRTYATGTERTYVQKNRKGPSYFPVHTYVVTADSQAVRSRGAAAIQLMMLSEYIRILIRDN
jgi:hypothetical protein